MKDLSCGHTLIAVLLCVGVKPYARCCQVKGLSFEHTLIIVLLCAGVRPFARCCKVKGLSCEYMKAGPSSHFNGAMAEVQCDVATGRIPLGMALPLSLLYFFIHPPPPHYRLSPSPLRLSHSLPSLQRPLFSSFRARPPLCLSLCL